MREADKGRIPELLPLRHGRMVVSPFTFYRGAALTMAVDLATTPVTGLRVQCCGDAHLLNFGGFATPERRVLFSVNDLDETLPAPWEWDLKRLATSFVLACRDNGHEPAARDPVLACAESYREHTAELSEMKPLDVWNLFIEAEAAFSSIRDAAIRRRAFKDLAKARKRSVPEDFFPELVRASGKSPVFVDRRPLVYHRKQTPLEVAETLAGYRKSLLAPSHRGLLDHYELKDVAIKVVGVGSVGTACWVLLMMDADGDPLILQVKEARPSVMEAYAGKSAFSNQGQRVVYGHWVMQPASDMFLGWTAGASGRHYYVRQLRDVKVKFRVEDFHGEEMTLFARWCGHALALSHARSGDPASISGYLGKSGAFDGALAVFAIAYADQTERDHAAFERAVRNGTIEASFEDETR